MTLAGHYNDLAYKFPVLVSHKTIGKQTYQNSPDQTSYTGQAEI